jgi:hypothetical protein
MTNPGTCPRTLTAFFEDVSSSACALPNGEEGEMVADADAWVAGESCLD